MNLSNGELLRRADVWSTQLKEILQDDLQGQQYVNWMQDFPDGDEFHIPSIGEASVRPFQDDGNIVYDALDTGEFKFRITEYLSSAHYITNAQRQDSFYASMIESEFLPKQRRAINEKIETDIMALANEQTANDPNVINGADHRFVGTGTDEIITAADFAKVVYALKKSNVGNRALVGIVDPSVEYTLNTLSNIVNVSNNPKWEGIIATGHTTGMTFMNSVYGIDLYTSNFLAEANETINSTTTAAGVANMFFSADSTILPFVGAFRQLPKVDAEYNKNRQREEYVTTARYGLKLYRPENLVVVLTDTDQV